MADTAVVVSAVNPYPTDAGKKVVLAGFLKYLTSRMGAENVHYLLVGGQAQPRFPAELHPLPKPSGPAKLGNVLIRTGTGRASLQESLLRSAEVRDAIHRKLDEIGPALEVYDTVRMSQFGRPPGTQRQICYLDDLFSERYHGMLSAAAAYPDVNINPLGNFGTHVPRLVRPLAEHRLSQTFLLKAEERLVRRSEVRTVDRYPTAVLLNEREADLLRSRVGSLADRVSTVPPLIRPPRYWRQFSGATDFVFLGQLSLPHNDDGLRSFLVNVWPTVLAARPNARLRVIGRDPRPALLDLIKRFHGSVSLEGFVPDLRELLGASAALVNPLRFGSGVKLKIIEALGAGLPVVSTAVGADGVSCGPDDGVVVADDPATMADLLLAIARPHTNARLSTAARAHFERCYSPAAVFASYDAVFSAA